MKQKQTNKKQIVTINTLSKRYKTTETESINNNKHFSESKTEKQQRSSTRISLPELKINIRAKSICLPLLKEDIKQNHKHKKRHRKTKSTAAKEERTGQIMKSLDRYGAYIKHSFVKISPSLSPKRSDQQIQIVAPIFSFNKFKVCRSRKMAGQINFINQRQNLRLMKRMLLLKPTECLSRNQLKKQYRQHRKMVKNHENSTKSEGKGQFNNDYLYYR